MPCRESSFRAWPTMFPWERSCGNSIDRNSSIRAFKHHFRVQNKTLISDSKYDLPIYLVPLQYLDLHVYTMTYISIEQSSRWSHLLLDILESKLTNNASHNHSLEWIAWEYDGCTGLRLFSSGCSCTLWSYQVSSRQRRKDLSRWVKRKRHVV